MATNQICLILDCDGTLAKDTTSLLVKEAGLSSRREFWTKVRAMTRKGWDPSLAWTTLLVKEAGPRLTRTFIKETAKKIEFHPEATRIRRALEGYCGNCANQSHIKAQLKVHVVTSGFEDLLLQSDLKDGADEIWGSLLDFDQTGRVIGPKSTVSFTEKTKFIFAINKGITKGQLRRKPERVNDLVPRNSRPVPFDHMIYVGDGVTDIPCYSLIQQHGGQAVGIRNEEDSNRRSKGPYLWNYRPRWGPFKPDYSQCSDLTKVLKDLVRDAVLRLPGADS